MSSSLYQFNRNADSSLTELWFLYGEPQLRNLNPFQGSSLKRCYFVRYGCRKWQFQCKQLRVTSAGCDVGLSAAESIRHPQSPDCRHTIIEPALRERARHMTQTLDFCPKNSFKLFYFYERTQVRVIFIHKSTSPSHSFSLQIFSWI
jgi:hypothetical protein